MHFIARAVRCSKLTLTAGRWMSSAHRLVLVGLHLQARRRRNCVACERRTELSLLSLLSSNVVLMPLSGATRIGRAALKRTSPWQVRT